MATVRGIVAGLACLAGDIGMAVIQRRAVHHRAMIEQIEARVEAGTRRPTGCCLRVVAAKQGAFSRQRVQMRRLHDRMAEGGEAFAPPLIRRNEKHVSRRLAHADPRYPRWLLPVANIGSTMGIRQRIRPRAVTIGRGPLLIGLIGR